MVKLPRVGPRISTWLRHHSAQCILALPVVFLPCNSTGLLLTPSYCLVLYDMFINLIPSSLPPTVIMWVFSCVSLSHRLEFLLSWGVSVQLHWLPCSLPFNPLPQCYWLTPYYWDTFNAHTFPYINSILGLQAFFWIPEPRGWEWQVVPKRWQETTTTHCPITQTSAVLSYFAAKAWNHARQLLYKVLFLWAYCDMSQLSQSRDRIWAGWHSSISGRGLIYHLSNTSSQYQSWDWD